MSRPRVVMATRIFDPEPSAASLRLRALARGLRGRADLTVVTTRPPEPLQGEDEPTVEITRWPVLRDPSGYVRGYLQYMSFDLPLFFRLVFGRQADVFVCEPPPTTGAIVRLAAIVRRRPYVYYAADIWSDASRATSAPRLVVRTLEAIERFALRGAEAVLVVTEGVAGRVREMAPGRPVTVVGHGVDLTTFVATGPAITSPADIVYVGSASEWHGASVALDAVVEVLLRDSALTAAFIGQGSEWQDLIVRATRSRVRERIRFLDTVPADRAAAWLRSARVALATLAPGQGYDFAVPTKLYAAIAVGTPVAYAGPDPVRAMINDERLGIGVSHDAESLADAITELLAQGPGTDADRLVKWAAENISAEGVAARSVDVILEAAAPESQGAPHVRH